jgi:hypothetical protein
MLVAFEENNFYNWQDDIVHEEEPLPANLESLVNEFFKDKNCRGEIPYGDPIIRNVLSKSMPFIANHFHSIKITAIKNDEQPSTVTPIPSTCCTNKVGKNGKAKKPKTKKPKSKKPKTKKQETKKPHVEHADVDINTSDTIKRIILGYIY